MYFTGIKSEVLKRQIVFYGAVAESLKAWFQEVTRS